MFGSLNEFVPTPPAMVVFPPSYELERAVFCATAPATWAAGPCPGNDGSRLLGTGGAPPIMPWSSFWLRPTPRTSLRALSKLANSYWVFLDLLLYFKIHKMIRLELKEETERLSPDRRASSPWPPLNNDEVWLDLPFHIEIRKWINNTYNLNYWLIKIYDSAFKLLIAI